ncbi:MAG: aminoglycoside phosphotransferase family protein [Rhodospirillaceae bacterium]|jgi:aminoglycoside phosphotransferase (APT) family kinase protein|nr:aminoglycoside phosphotransferase family protein [Rhodospirillaceae bacterium]
MQDEADSAPEAVFNEFLVHGGLIRPDAAPRYTALTGGVSSDIWRVDLPDRQFCIKRALKKLKVADDWFVPISRNANEVAWLQTANQILPGSAPEVLAHDADAGMFAMEFIAADEAPLWKEELRHGNADITFAAATGRALATIHARTAAMPDLAERFATDDTFHAIRLEPYLETTARRHPDLAAQLMSLVKITAQTKIALVHGDVSPKNILVRASGPVFLDAECAWWGDPAFDLAFCLNHLLLKCLWTPQTAPAFLKCFHALADAYLDTLPVPLAGSVEVRTAHLLPGLFLARIDGKSPVEYITNEADKDRVRRVARGLLSSPVTGLSSVLDHWAREIGVSL